MATGVPIVPGRRRSGDRAAIPLPRKALRGVLDFGSERLFLGGANCGCRDGTPS
jgi:hypothetical protein